MENLPSVTVITATVGPPALRRAVRSVLGQTYANLRHLVVVDGPEWFDRANAGLAGIDDDRLEVLRLPHATGKNTWCGHRIYAATPFIVLSDYVCWLDDDNWFDPDHLESLLASVGQAGTWSFSLRKIVDVEGNEIALDQCESLGNLSSTFLHPEDFLVDTNCYLVRRDIAMRFAEAWNHPARSDKGPGPDRILCRLLMDHFPDARCSMRYSLNYTVGNTAASVRKEFFRGGNRIMRRRYPDGPPWAYD